MAEAVAAGSARTGRAAAPAAAPRTSTGPTGLAGLSDVVRRHQPGGVGGVRAIVSMPAPPLVCSGLGRTLSGVVHEDVLSMHVADCPAMH
jgi:hypothetical protein